MRYISKGIDENSCRKALLNARNAFDPKIKFPNNVFTRSWDCYLFFPSDRMLRKDFANSISEFIFLEQANIVCLLNLTRSPSLEFESAAALYLDKDINESQYHALIWGSGPAEAEGWIFNMEDYICTSDVGSWCMYCERTNDIAVLALSNAGLTQFRPALDILQPYTLEEACRPGQDGVFPFNYMIPEWHDGLFKNYVYAQKNHREMKG
ncbi:MAG: hypothetical protein RBR37_01225 [Advenella sp.]|nr:hypothetical protein [Advenella sp.]